MRWAEGYRLPKQEDGAVWPLVIMSVSPERIQEKERAEGRACRPRPGNLDYVSFFEPSPCAHGVIVFCLAVLLKSPLRCFLGWQAREKLK